MWRFPLPIIIRYLSNSICRSGFKKHQLNDTFIRSFHDFLLFSHHPLIHNFASLELPFPSYPPSILDWIFSLLFDIASLLLNVIIIVCYRRSYKEPTLLRPWLEPAGIHFLLTSSYTMTDARAAAILCSGRFSLK